MSTTANYQASPDRPGSQPVGGDSRRVVGEAVNERTADPARPSDPDMTGQLGNLGADLLTLGELQLELLKVDAHDAAKQSYVPTVFAFLGLGFVIGCCPLALLGLSWWLTDATTLSLAASSLIIAVIGLVIAAVCLFVAWKGYRHSLGLLDRSRSEFRSNLQWIKKILSQKQ